MKKGFRYFFMSCLAVLMLALPMAETMARHGGGGKGEDGMQEVWRQQLAAQIEAVLNEANIEGAQVGISIRAASTGEILYQYEGEKRLVPASNQKLLVAATALHHLGADYRFETSVWTDGQQAGDVLHGNLYLRGSGDPTLTPERIQQLAQLVREQGIQHVTGGLYLDDSWFDSIRLGEDWAWDNESSYVAAPVSALTFASNQDYDASAVLVQLKPGKQVGAPVEITLVPAVTSMEIQNTAITIAAGEKGRLHVEREHGRNLLKITGTLPLDHGGVNRWCSVWDPTEVTGELFLAQLVAAGVQVEGEMLVGITPAGGRRITSIQSIPLAELMVPFMKLSNNSHAEILTKSLGRVVKNEGSWEAGLQVVKEYLQAKGVATEKILLRDGSGMSHLNLIPTNEVTSLLFAIQHEPYFPLFLESLPLAGDSERMRGGTMRNRLQDMDEGKVWAKTGSLTAVDTLAGYVTTKHGEELIFALFFNHFLGPHPTATEDEIIRRLVMLDLP